MSATVEFVWDSRDLDVWRGGKVETALARALAKAGGDAARTMRTESNRLVRSKKKVKASAVSKALPLTFPRSKDIARLAWRMDVSGALVPVAAFPHSQTAFGVMVQINQGASKLIRSAFIATMRSGHEGVFLRKGKGRLPIREAFTTRVSDVFLDGGFIPAIQAKTQAKFASSFERLLPLELRKLRWS